MSRYLLLSPFRIILLAALGFALAASLVSCTQYERDGYNPKPFNAPAGWETTPRGVRFQN